MITPKMSFGASPVSAVSVWSCHRRQGVSGSAIWRFLYFADHCPRESNISLSVTTSLATRRPDLEVLEQPGVILEGLLRKC
jgi:hypothetical protein